MGAGLFPDSSDRASINRSRTCVIVDDINLTLRYLFAYKLYHSIGVVLMSLHRNFLITFPQSVHHGTSRTSALQHCGFI